MSRRVRLSREVRDWLSALLAEDHQAGRTVGEAVTVLLTTGLGLGAPLESVLRAHHPGIALDHAYQRQLHLLRRMPRSDTDWRLPAEVDAFRTRKEAVKAGYTVALAEQVIERKVPARAAVDELLRAADDLERRLGGDTGPRIRELRIETSGLRLLFAVASPDTAVLLVAGIGYDDWDPWYEEALPLARDELERPDEEFTGYDLTAFLAEYFPGEETDVQAGAARLNELDGP